MIRLLACFIIAAACFHGYDAVPLVETSTAGKLTTTLKTTTAAGKLARDDGLSVRFGTFDMDEGDIIFPGVGTRAFGASKSSSDTSLSSSLASSSSISGAANKGVYPPRPQNYEFTRPGQDSQPCVCCGSKGPCGRWPINGGLRVPQGNIPPQVPFNPQYPEFQVDPIPVYNGQRYSGSKASSSSFSNQNFGGNYFGNQGYPNGIHHQPSIYPSGSGSSASSSSFSGGFGYPGVPNQGGFPGMFDRPFPPSGYPVPSPAGGYGGSSSLASSSSSSFNGGAGSSSWSSSGSSSGTKGGLKPVRPVRPNPPSHVTPEFSLPDGMCRTTGC